jgi:hypothetical protein
MRSSSLAYADDDVVDVQLRALPVSLAARAREHREQLLREFVEITAEVVDGDADAAGHEVPVRLLDLVVSTTQRLHGFNDAAEEAFDAALAEGADTIDNLVLRLPAQAAAAIRATAELLDEADLYCWSGERLLNLVTPADCVAYRRGLVSQILDQLDGRHPVRWPESVAARTL